MDCHLDVRSKIAACEYDSKIPYTFGTRSAWKADTNRLKEVFKADIFLEIAVTTSNKDLAEKMFDIAWDLGHSAGLHEVYTYFTDLWEEVVKPQAHG